MKLRTPQKKNPCSNGTVGRTLQLALTTPQRNAAEEDKIKALADEVKELKEMFLATQSPAAGESRVKPLAPIPSPRRVLMTPMAQRGTPRADVGNSPADTLNGSHMNALNRQIREWIASAPAEADLTPQLSDYIKHVRGWREVHDKWFRSSKSHSKTAAVTVSLLLNMSTCGQSIVVSTDTNPLSPYPSNLCHFSVSTSTNRGRFFNL